MMVWRSVRAGGDTKTKKSRRTLALPQRCVEALSEQRERQRTARSRASTPWTENDLVFASEAGTELDAANVRRGFRRVAAAAGLDAARWTPRELRHSFVSLLRRRGADRADRAARRTRGWVDGDRDGLSQAAATCHRRGRHGDGSGLRCPWP